MFLLIMSVLAFSTSAKINPFGKIETVDPTARPTKITMVGGHTSVLSGVPSHKMGVATETTSNRIESSASYANGAANRSPKRPPVPIASDPSRVSSVKSNVQSWGLDGQPRASLRWSVPLIQAARSTGVYAKLVEAVSDPWTVLTLWVPSKFMGPQKVGRKANGAIMIPPTKGRDIGVYLSEYNASWHVSFTSDNMEYHAQVVHRNAIAVCIRERLNLNAVFVHATAEEAPLLVYHCPCRHCSEGVAEGASQPTRKLVEEFPTFVDPSRSAGGVTLPTVVVPIQPAAQQPVTDSRTQQQKELRDSSACLEGDAAPWLVPRRARDATVVAFPYEGLQGSLRDLLALQADPLSGAIMVVIFNKFWIDHLHNYIFSMVHRGGFRHYLVATMDEEALKVCVENRLPCFDASRLAELEEDMSASNVSGGKGFVRKVTEAMSWIKPRLALAVLQLGYHFFMSDLDLSFNLHPISHLLKAGVDIAHQCDAKGKLSINSGFYFARSNYRVIRFFHNIMTFTPEENSDQTAMKLFAKYDKTHSISHNCLDRKLFSMKCYYKVEGSVKLINQRETFQWYEFNRDRSSFDWVIHHATCLAGALPKLVYLRTINAWFLDDLDAFTGAVNHTSSDARNRGDMKRTYCLRLPTSPPEDYEQSRDVQTVHSPKYSTQLRDDIFLQQRH